MQSFFFCHSLFLLSHPFLPFSLLLSPPLGEITLMPVEQRINLSCLTSYPPTWPATISGKVPIHRCVCTYVLYVHTYMCSAVYFVLCRVYCTCSYFIYAYVCLPLSHLLSLPYLHPPNLPLTLPPPSLSPSHPSLT